MNCLSLDESRYPRLDNILYRLEYERLDLSDIDYSSSFNSWQVSTFRDLILDAHGGEYRKRKDGGLYIEEHIAEVMEFGEQMRVPPSVIIAYGLHDFIEDHRNKTSYSIDKQSSREGNKGYLEQQIRNMSLKSIDRNIILNVTGFMTKPTDEELEGTVLNNKDEKNSNTKKTKDDDRRFVGKVFGSLGGKYWDRKLLTGCRVNDTQRFYSWLGILLDTYSNSNSQEEPKPTDENPQKFYSNLRRNTLRMVQMGRLLDFSIRNSSTRHLLLDRDEYDRFREEKFIPRMVEGIDKFSINIEDKLKQYWNL